MSTTLTLFSTTNDLIIRFNDLIPVSWYEITSLNDQDEDGKLYGSECLLYEEPRIDSRKIQEQFSDSPEADVNEDGVLYLSLRAGEMRSHAPGYGRRAKVGVDRDGKIAAIRIAWNSPRAGTPYVDRHVALSGLSYEEGDAII